MKVVADTNLLVSALIFPGDPPEAFLLEAAASARAQAIVSGDRHVLALGSWSGIPVQSPAAFLSEVPG